MRYLFIYISLLFVTQLSGQDSIRINEVCSRNSKVITDENENYEDWIEIYNYGTQDIDLSNFHLSDDKNAPLMWQFPEIILKANDYILIFASGESKKILINHWETALFGDSLWRFKNPSDENNDAYDYVNWSNTDYDDSEWSISLGAFGTPDGYEATVTECNPDLRTMYLRQEFFITDTSQLLSAMIHAYYDDGITAYINGYEILRENVIHNGIKPHHSTSAFLAHPSNIDNGIPPEGFMIPEKYFKNILKNGRNVFAIENHNFWSNNPQVIKPWLSFASKDENYQLDTIPACLNTHQLSIHCNFKIKSDGEKIYLTDSVGNLIQKFNTPALSSNISVGIHPNHIDSIVFYATPSPWEINAIDAQVNLISDTILLHYISGYYKDSIKVEVKDKHPLFTIRFTTDGSLPRDTALVYDTAFYVDTTSVFRFRYFSDSLIAGPVSNYTYLINDSSSLEYFSIITDPYNLWDNDYGIYAFGDHYAPQAPYFEANFWQKWERDVHLQHFSPQGGLLWQQDAGIKIHGNWTRMLDQKSFGFYAKSAYSNSKFDHTLFPKQPYRNSYKRFLLRNAGNDNRWGFLRDLLIHTRMKNEDIDIQMGKTVSSYLNGEYWGIYHLREKIDRFYVEENWGVSPDSVNLLEQNGLVISGNRNEFENLMHFVQNNDLSIQTNYQYVSDRIDINNWINNLISNLYHHNTDWPHHNTKFWNSSDHKWRQILVDQDVTMALRSNNIASKNSLTQIQNDSISYLAIMYKALLKNVNFKIQYSNRFADLMNTIFLEENYLPLFDSIMEKMDPEMQKHGDRWGMNYDSWKNIYTERIKTFIKDKPPYMRAHLRHQYSLGTYDTITLSVNPLGKGRIKLNSLFITDENWSGLYYDSIPINLEAIPNPGFQFVEWQSATSPQLADSGRIIKNWYLKAHDSITAIFYSPTGVEDTLSVAFCEINYRKFSNAEAGDWVEIINLEDETINLSHWTLSGGKSDGDKISLRDELNREVSKMVFGTKEPWPNSDQTARTIEMLSDNDDYHLAESWSLACPGGSPGLPPQLCYQNDQLIFTEINYKSNPNYDTDDWVEILNKSTIPINLSHWIFRDANDNNQFIFPEGTMIAAQEKIIIAADTSKYYEFNANKGQVFGPLNFGFSAKEEELSISNQFDLSISELYYTNDDPWPKEVAGSGYTIELSDTALNMSNGENWRKNCFLGTPLVYPQSCVHAKDLIISEIKYQSDIENESADWIEFYNTSANDISLNNWQLIHNSDTLVIDTNYFLQANSYVTLSADTSLFYKIYDTDITAIHLPYFDLQKDEDLIFILDPYKNIGNYLNYNHLLNWPIFYNDTNNRTLELINYQDIYDPSNWRSGCEYGTPSASYSNCITDDINEISTGNYQLNSHPLPFKNFLDIEFYLTKNEKISISIFDLNSNVQLIENQGVLLRGKQTIRLNSPSLTSLPSGIYILQIQGEEASEYQKIIKIQ